MDRKANSNHYLKKKGIRYLNLKNKLFFKFWSPTYCNNGFQKNVNGRIWFPLNRKSVATVCNRGFV